MEATGVYWHTPWQALTDAGIEAQLLHAQHVKQLRGRKTDVEDSRWLARVCQFGLGRPSFVPDQQFRDLRSLSRHRRKLVARRSQVRNQAQKVIDRAGVRVGAVLSDIFGTNGRRVLDGLVSRLDPKDILASLSWHVRRKLDQLGDALNLTLRETERRLLADLLTEHDAISQRIGNFDRHIDEDLAPYAEQAPPPGDPPRRRPHRRLRHPQRDRCRPPQGVRQPPPPRRLAACGKSRDSGIDTTGPDVLHSHVWRWVRPVTTGLSNRCGWRRTICREARGIRSTND